MTLTVETGVGWVGRDRQSSWSYQSSQMLALSSVRESDAKARWRVLKEIPSGQFCHVHTDTVLMIHICTHVHIYYMHI